MSPAVTAWAIEALLASTLLMAFVLLVRRPAQRAIGPQLAYWLWALPALRMAMPPLPAAWRENVAAPVAAASETVLVYIAPAADAAVADPLVAPFPWLIAVAVAWGLGALAFFAWHGAAHVAYVRRIVSPPARHERLADGTTLVESEEAIGPVAFGVLKRFVAVPQDFADRYDEDERRLALAHELGHHARGDLIANWIALALLAIHWFNPLAWIAYRKFRTDQELANDARVLASLPRIERHAYACAILKAAHGRAITAACHLHTIEDLKGRLKMLKETRKSRGVLLAGATGIAALTVAGLGLTGSTAAAEKLRSVAVEQAPAIVAQVAAAEPAMPAIPVTRAIPAGQTSDGRRDRTEAIVEDGRTETLAGNRASGLVAANPDVTRPSGRVIRTNRLVIRTKDGETQVYEGEAADAYLKAHPEMRPPSPPLPPRAPSRAWIAPVPPLFTPGAPVHISVRRNDVAPSVTSARCGAGGPTTIQRWEGKRRIDVICTDRMEASFAAAMEAAAAAKARGSEIERQAYASALRSLRNARANVAANVPAEGRAEALAAIDESIDELESQRD